MKAYNVSIWLWILVIITILILPGQSFAIDSESIVGIWLFDEGQGNVVEDVSGNGNDGEIVGATKWVEGIRGQALEFDGTSHVRIPATATTDDYRDGFTYLLWAKPLNTPTDFTRLIERDYQNPAIHIRPTSFFGCFLVNGEPNGVEGGTHQIGEWYFVALTHDGSTLSLYVDGELVDLLKVGEPDSTNDFDGGSIWLAQWKGGAGWDFTGVIDEVGVFNTALSTDDIKSIMDKGLSPAAVSSSGKLAGTWGDIKVKRP